MSDTQLQPEGRDRPIRRQIRRRALPAERRGDFDRMLLAGEDIDRLARRFGIEPWYAKRRANRILAQTREGSSQVATMADFARPSDDMTPTEYAVSLLGSRVITLPSGYLVLDGVHVGPREVMRAANRLLRDRGLPEIRYPGLLPLT